MTMELDHTATQRHAAPKTATKDDEPWAIWAGLMVFLNILVISGMIYGLAGIVSVMVVAAFAMVLMLIRIVTAGI